MTLLKPGTRGDQVKSLQTKLQQLGFELESDENYGPATRAAVEELQALFGYDVDGIAGDATQKLVDQQTGLGFRVSTPDAVKRGLDAQGKAEGPKLQRTLKRGSKGADVRYLQRRLSALGYGVTVDGDFGEATENAVRALQKQFGYDIDGMVGEATDRLLYQQIGYGFRAQS